ncbi:MAG: hypothetical protein ABFD77_09465 [Thermotogota bacterium]
MFDDTHGTPLSVTVGGISFDMLADTDFSQTLAAWKNEGVATTGLGMIKKTKQVPKIDAVDVSGGAATLGRLALLAESRVPLPITFTDPGATTWVGAGWVDLGEHSGANGKTPVSLIFKAKPVPVG